MTELQAGWDAAVAECLEGHGLCSYGGMSPSFGYWLRDEACPRSHGEVCAWCSTVAVTGFVGRVPNGWEIFVVPACQACADAWVAEHPEWARRDPDPTEESKSVDELLADAETSYARMLADLDPVTRAVWQEADRRMENMLLWGNPDGPPPGAQDGPQFTGLESLFGLGAAPKLVAPGPPARPGPPRLRFNSETRKWEANRG